MASSGVGRWASLQEIADAAGCSVRTIRRRIARGAIKAPGGVERVRRVPLEAVADWSPSTFAALLRARAAQ